jgi:sugar fermentation stimulation protein A
MEAIDKGLLVPFQDYRVARREVVFGESRLDLLLEGPHDFCFVEVKSVTLVESGNGLFPDAPTTRGRKHVGSLAQAVREGHRAAVIFVIQREDVIGFRPNDNADPEFGQALREAVRQGVEVHAFRCHVTPRTVEIDLPIPVSL